MAYTKDTIYTVYVIQNNSGKLYKGITNCLEHRLYQHNHGLSKWTSGRGPFKLVYKEEFKTKKDALKKEKYFKTGKGREFLNQFTFGV